MKAKRRTRLSVSMTPSLRQRIEEARAQSGYTMSAQIEALLRTALNHQHGDGLLLLRVDDGLMNWLRAFVDGPGFFGDLEKTAIYLMRSHLLEMIESDVWYGATVPKLREPARSANMESPKYRALVAAALKARTP